MLVLCDKANYAWLITLTSLPILVIYLFSNNNIVPKEFDKSDIVY
jgi:hypothetical protein